ncbi:MAG: hypothetical protein A2V88_17600 [Elusimicrobia bacterium RBG_16_66_12]|nr:MAG: hypothetical protein A2V88_17600 [Elusimicrobia bacterium RBG_16_66_12]
MTPQTCPGCGTKLEPEMLACPNCPMSFPEDEPTSGVHPLRQTKAYAFLMPALFFAAVLGGVLYLAFGLFRLGEQNAVPEPSPIFRDRASTTTASADSSPTGYSAAAPEEEPAAGEEPAAVAVSIVAQEPEKKRRRVKEWRLRGHVYDLSTLRPVPGCALVFVDDQAGRRVETRSRDDGSYRVVAAPLPDRGYSASLSKQGYSPAYLNPGTEGVPQMPAAQRNELSKELSVTLTFTPYSVQAYDEQPLVTDFYLAPRP